MTVGTSTDIADRVSAIRARIHRAAEAAGRDPTTIRLIGATKTVAMADIEEAAAAGVREFGENRVQEALAKMAQAPPRRDAWTWHLIGRLQTNKVRMAVGRFALIHSVDSLRLGEAIEQAAAGAGIRQSVLVQVNLGDEPQKGGVAPSDLGSLLGALAQLPHLRVEGLMAVPPVTSDPEQSRPFFRSLRRLGTALAEAIPRITTAEYSMGMSDDFEVAIAEGATMVRIGTAIFGARGGHAAVGGKRKPGEPSCS